MANELTTAQKATIDDDTHHALPAGSYSAVSDDTDVATVAAIGGYLFVVAQGVGTATITATRGADQATGELEVTVNPVPAPGTFTLLLGAISPK